MRPDTSLSKYAETADTSEFTAEELYSCRFLLRRLQFLEAKSRDSTEVANGGAVFAKTEADALAWVLGPEGVDFLDVREPV